MFENYDLLSDLPDADAAVTTSGINTPISAQVPGSGMEIGEAGLAGFNEHSSITVETDYQPLIPSEAAFDSRLIFEVALGFKPYTEIYPRYNLTEIDWLRISRQPSFRNAVIKKQDEIAEEGISYRLKARTQAEAYLKDLHLLIKNPTTSPNVRLEAIKYITKVSDLEPKPNKEDTGTTFNLQINL